MAGMASPSTDTENNDGNTASTPSYLIRTSMLPPNSGSLFSHPLNSVVYPGPSSNSNSQNGPIIQRNQFSLGAETNLTRTGVHLCSLAPGKESTVLHWHVAEDEWIWVLSCGKGARLVTYDEAVGEEQSMELKEGDFLGFAAGLRVARKLVNDGDAKEELRYLVGGNNAEMDVVHYPTIGGGIGGGRRAVMERTGNGKDWWVDGDEIDKNLS